MNSNHGGLAKKEAQVENEESSEAKLRETFEMSTEYSGIVHQMASWSQISVESVDT